MKRGGIRWILLLALVVRLMLALSLDSTAALNRTSDDGRWYLSNGYSLVTGLQPPTGIVTDVSTLEQPPLYFVLVGVPMALFAPETAVLVIRVVQGLLGILTVYMGYRMARLLAGDDTPRGETAGRISALVLAVAPNFVLENAAIKTETLYIALLMAGLWAAMAAVAHDRMHGTFDWRRWALAGIGLGGAALTRSAGLGFWLFLALGIVLAFGPRGGLKRAAVLIAAFALALSTWTAYNLFAYQRLIIGGAGIASFVYLGAEGWDDPTEVDAALGITSGSAADNQQIIVEAAADAITSDIPGYLAYRARELSGALLQPHGTEAYGGESLRALAAGWLANDRSVEGLLRLTRAPAFWDKLALYVVHYAGLVFGFVGLVMLRARWRLAMPIASALLYILALHTVLFVLPRYVFPMLPLLWVLAGVSLSAFFRPRAQMPPLR
ncbi:MAG: glycosyltransferase family 39 protein [Pleurocapsa minor GSE-CHR-MK-17-07R]|jgi:4-amino-4-deoxy-L-arabinose transferase-like glycosyltransferase|nr:glycosyltransferase family 39 protein [Pleurocapsa minor GSE-CHR-MK 17-07R]